MTKTGGKNLYITTREREERREKKGRKRGGLEKGNRGVGDCTRVYFPHAREQEKTSWKKGTCRKEDGMA